MADKPKKPKKPKKEEDEEPKCIGRSYTLYYDSPDGCDMDKKILVASRYGIVAGMIAGTYDVLLYSHAVELVPILKRYARHMIPLGLMGATFAAVANTAQHARKIDDKWNYFLGGLACGPLVALYTGSRHGLVAGGVLLGLIAIVKKESVDSKFTILQDFPNHMNTINGWKQDWTLVQDPRDEMIHTCEDPYGDDEGEGGGKKKKKLKKPKKVCN